MKTNMKKTASFPTEGTPINYAEMLPKDFSIPERIIARLIDEGKIDGKTAILLLKAVYKPVSYPTYPNYPPISPSWTAEPIKTGTDTWSSTYSFPSEKCSDSTK